MNIEIDHEVLTDAVKASVSQAVIDAMKNYKLQGEIQTHVVAAVSASNLPAIVEAELRRVLTEEIDDIVSESVRSAMPGLRSAVGVCIRSAATGMIYGLKLGKPSSYDSSGTAAWNEAVAQVKGGRDAIQAADRDCVEPGQVVI